MYTNMTAIRLGGAADLSAVAAIQQATAEAAQWQVADYLLYNFLVAELENRVVGFLVARDVAEDEREILNLAIAPDFRRRGLAKDLLDKCLKGFSGTVVLEVRESNLAAQSFYKCLGFQELNRRPEYYENPSESAIVMKFHSC
jgi:ribosomal-protein-alanine acetyltransferase